MKQITVLVPLVLFLVGCSGAALGDTNPVSPGGGNDYAAQLRAQALGAATPTPAPSPTQTATIDPIPAPLASISDAMTPVEASVDDGFGVYLVYTLSPIFVFGFGWLVAILIQRIQQGRAK